MISALGLLLLACLAETHLLCMYSTYRLMMEKRFALNLALYLASFEHLLLLFKNKKLFHSQLKLKRDSKHDY